MLHQVLQYLFGPIETPACCFHEVLVSARSTKGAAVNTDVAADKLVAVVILTNVPLLLVLGGKHVLHVWHIQLWKDARHAHAQLDVQTLAQAVLTSAANAKQQLL